MATTENQGPVEADNVPPCQRDTGAVRVTKTVSCLQVKV